MEIAERRKRIALGRYSRASLSLEKAAEIAGVAVWEFIDLLKGKRVPLNLSAEQILEAAEMLKQRKK